MRAGSRGSLADLAAALRRPDLLRADAPGDWWLAANLTLEAGAQLTIAAPVVWRLRLRSDAEQFVALRARGAILELRDVCILAWDAARRQPDQQVDDGRSFILARDGARLLILRSELSFLGYDAPESYGVALRLEGTTGRVEDSVLGYNYYGLYAYAASDLLIRGNRVHHSLRYGIDPHTRSNRLRIENNLADHNGKHGIILAEGCSDSVVRDNVAYANRLHGIVIYQHSDHNLVEYNLSYANGDQGINVNQSANTMLRGNTVHHNGSDGIGVGQEARATLVEGNLVFANRKDGISIYSAARGTVLRDNQVRDNARAGIYIKSPDNRIEGGNQVSGNQIGVWLNVTPAPLISLEDNQIQGNREADLRRPADS